MVCFQTLNFLLTIWVVQASWLCHILLIFSFHWHTLAFWVGWFFVISSIKLTLMLLWLIIGQCEYSRPVQSTLKILSLFLLSRCIKWYYSRTVSWGLLEISRRHFYSLPNLEWNPMEFLANIEWNPMDSNIEFDCFWKLNNGTTW